MSILNSIVSKVLGKSSVAGAGPSENPAPSSPVAQVTPTSSAQAVSAIDVAATLDALKAKTPEDLNWRVSIVDLMKLLSLDSSLSSRKELAKELHYDGDASDTAKMNIWLHKQIMTKLAENGGKVPDELKH